MLNICHKHRLSESTKKFLLEMNEHRDMSNENKEIEGKLEDEDVFKDSAIPDYLDLLFKELSFEKQKKSSLETRAGIMTTLVGGAGLFIVDKVKISDLFEKSSWLMSVDLLASLLSILIYITFLILLIYLSSILTTKEILNYDVRSITDSCYYKNRSVELIGLIDKYKKVVLSYRCINQKKARHLVISIRLIIVIIIMLIIILNI